MNAVTQSIKSITVIGRRWFHRGPGNTYHSAQMLVDGRSVGSVDYHYGYGNQYEYSAFAQLKADGYLPDWDSQKDSPWSYCAARGIAYVATYSDVQRKKDL